MHITATFTTNDLYLKFVSPSSSTKSTDIPEAIPTNRTTLRIVWYESLAAPSLHLTILRGRFPAVARQIYLSDV